MSHLISLVDELSQAFRVPSLSVQMVRARVPGIPSLSVQMVRARVPGIPSLSVQMVRARVPVIPGLTMLFCCVPGGHLVPRPHAGTDIAQVTTDAMVLKAVFLFQEGAGILGNAFLLSTYNSSFLTAHRPKPTDMVLSSLAVANSLVLVSKGTPYVVGVLGLPGALETAGCRVTYYLHRVSQDRSLCTTGLLSCLQATAISPGVRHGQPSRAGRQRTWAPPACSAGP